MIETVHAILTDTNARKKRVVKKRLISSVSAGIPWFSKQNVDEQ